MNSLRERLLVAGALILILFCAFVLVALDRAFHSSALEAQQERMQGLVYSLLGSVDVAPGEKLTFNELSLQNQLFFQKGSGLAAVLVLHDGRVLWKSPSWPPDVSVKAPNVGIGQWLFLQPNGSGGRDPFRLAFGVSWILEAGKTEKFTILLDQDSDLFARQLHSYRTTTLRWLLAAVILLFISLWHVLRWGMRPLRGIARELEEIRTGSKEAIEQKVPDELKDLTDGLNSLLRHERSQQKRFRNSLDDLAHSLKNPLAAIQSFASHVEQPEETRVKLTEQIEQMGKIVDYQLRRASTAGRTAFTQPVSVRTLAGKLVAALEKVHREKGVKFSVEVSPALRVAMDEGDLMEVIGNLLDNAAKWCTGQVRLSAVTEDRTFKFCVEDDGPGFPKEQRNQLLERGVRADQKVAGQGIGLSVVREIVTLYGGTIRLADCPSGGGRVEVEVPG